MDKRQKSFIVIISILLLVFIGIGVWYIINSNKIFNDLVTEIKDKIGNTYIVKVEYSDSVDEDGEVENGKIVFITNENTVNEIVYIISNAKMDKINEEILETTTTADSEGIDYTLEFLDKDNEVILTVNNSRLTYQEKTLKVTYDQEKIDELIKNVE